MKKRILGVTLALMVLFSINLVFNANSLQAQEIGIALDGESKAQCRIERPRPADSNTSCIRFGNTTFRCTAGAQGNYCH